MSVHWSTGGQAWTEDDCLLILCQNTRTNGEHECVQVQYYQTVRERMARPERRMQAVRVCTGALRSDSAGASGKAPPRVTRYDHISIWEINMGYRYGRSDINEISIWISICDVGYRYGIWCIDLVIYHIDTVIRDRDMEYGLMI